MLSWRGEEGEDGQTARLAVVFTDLEGFTAFTAANGDEAASRLLTEHLQAAGPVVRSRGGRLVKRLGDGLLLTFPAAEAAVLACLELVEAAGPLRLRAGVHVGDVVVRRDDVVGHVVNVAARVTESAKGGQVLVSGEVRDEVGGPRAACASVAAAAAASTASTRAVLVCPATRACSSRALGDRGVEGARGRRARPGRAATSRPAGRRSRGSRGGRPRRRGRCRRWPGRRAARRRRPRTRRRRAPRRP